MKYPLFKVFICTKKKKKNYISDKQGAYLAIILCVKKNVLKINVFRPWLFIKLIQIPKFILQLTGINNIVF